MSCHNRQKEYPRFSLHSKKAANHITGFHDTEIICSIQLPVSQFLKRLTAPRQYHPHPSMKERVTGRSIWKKIDVLSTLIMSLFCFYDLRLYSLHIEFRVDKICFFSFFFFFPFIALNPD